jgi:acetylornithine/LysW-gamma-L-lysine aminotransferase
LERTTPLIETTKNYLELEARHGTGAYHPRGVTLVRGSGAIVWDDAGQSYIDCTAAYGTSSLGHCHPAVVAALCAQAGELIGCNSSFANNQRALLMSELAAVLPKGMERLFFCNSGTEAIEAAIKFARLTTNRPGIVAAMRGFHGRTFGALSATWDAHYREPFAPLVPGFRHVPFNNIAALEEALTDEVGAVLLEVVQGEGGVRPATSEFLESAARLCLERDALLIIDEVQTGFGRTGALFAVEHFNLKPDLLCLAKGIASGFPMGAVALGERVVRLPVGAHGSTFGGNPLGCAAARATLCVLREEKLSQQATEKGAYLMKRLEALESRRIREVRGLGLMIGVELRERVAPFLQELQRRGILALNAGPTVLRLLPPLVISYEEMDRAVEEIKGVLG